jgi:UDP-2,3-diacylglucosamine pyrophosphatase LpxH
MRFGLEIDDDWLPHRPRGYRALFLSDMHLGSRGCQSERLIDFLHNHEAETIYLVGDIVDGWRLGSKWYWPAAHNEIVQILLRAARRGVRIVYMPGNHDAFLRDFYGTHFGGIEVVDQTVHVAADGRRYLVTHGDSFDAALKHTQRFAFLGGSAIRATTAVNSALNGARRCLGLSHWSLSQWAKLKVKHATNYLTDFEQGLAELALRHQVDGVICGHVHHATIHDDLGIRYINCGDWIESCTAVAEHGNGSFEIVSWQDAGSHGDRAVMVSEAHPA